MPRFSIITVSFNSIRTIERTLLSVRSQTCSSREHVVIDGGSTDGTLDVLRGLEVSSAQVHSGPDGGIYDAMNKGIDRSCGDIIAFLNSDDQYADAEVLKDVADTFESQRCDFVYGDITMINRKGIVVREWKTGTQALNGLRRHQIPHPAFFVSRQAILRLDPPFDASYKIAGDLKQQLLLINRLRLKGAYLPRAVVKMETGGASTGSIRNHIAGWRESRRAYNEAMGSGGALYTIRKVTSKITGIRRLEM